MSKPYDLADALSGRVGGPGDTFWLMGGNYAIGHINTKIHGAPGRPITFRGIPGVLARVDGSLEFWDSPGYIVLRDFEIYSSDANRASSQTNIGFKPTDLHLHTGISSFAPNLSFINLIMHDETQEGIYVSQTSSNNLVYGCVIYNIGWRSPDNAEGHGIYMQGWNGGREIADNIVFNNSGADLHVYDDTPRLPLGNITLTGNVAFNAGAIQNARFYRDMVIGVDAPSTIADDIVFENNMGYFPPEGEHEDRVEIGRQGFNGTVTILDNYLPEGLEMNNWRRATVTGNVFGTLSSHDGLKLNEKTALNADWNHNTYVTSQNGEEAIAFNSRPLIFPAWKKETGYDSDSVCKTSGFSGTRVFVRPNRYEPGRANIIVYNWDGLSNVAVDAGSVLSPGEHFEVRNAEDYFASPVLRGVFNGQPLKLPMRGLTVAKPDGPMVTPQPTGPKFNVFVLLKESPRQITNLTERSN